MGNINRSAVAEYILKHLLKQKGIQNIEVISRGTTPSFGSWGSKPTLKMRTIAKENNIEDFENHRASPITKEDIESSDIVYYMDLKNKRKLIKLFGEEIISNKCALLLGEDIIEDPMDKKDIEFYRKTFKIIFDRINHLINI